MTNQSRHAHAVRGEKTLSAYITGLGLCLLLTFASFYLTENHVISRTMLFVSLSALAIGQLIVQAICFLRLNTSREGQWNLLPFIFSLIIITILVGGSLWIMYNLNYNMVSHT